MLLVYLLQRTNCHRYMSQMIKLCGCESYQEPTLTCIGDSQFTLLTVKLKLFNIKMNCPILYSPVVFLIHINLQ